MPSPDIWADADIITALKECVRLLGPIAAEIDVSGPIKSGVCGAPAPVLLRGLGGPADKVEFRPAVPLNCRMVVALNTWVVGTVQPAARELLGSPISRISSSSYSCRGRNNNANDVISEHAFANAIDVATFTTADGRSVDVLKGWGPTTRDSIAKKNTDPAATPAVRATHKDGQEATKPAGELDKPPKRGNRASKGDTLETANMRLGARVEPTVTAKMPATVKGASVESPPSAESQFLHRLHSGACAAFATVLGPEANEDHRNHFHLDLQHRARKAYCH